MRHRSAAALSLAILGAALAGPGVARQFDSAAFADASQSGSPETGTQTLYTNIHFRQFGLTAPQAACSVLLGNSSQAYAEISLPDAVTLTSLRFDGSNNNQEVNTNTVFLERVDVATCAVTVVGSVPMNEFFTNSFRESALDHVVDNANSLYRIRLLVPTLGSMNIKRIRIGYEGQVTAAACPGDNNGDNQINGSDLSVLLANFGGSCP